MATVDGWGGCRAGNFPIGGQCPSQAGKRRQDPATVRSRVPGCVRGSTVNREVPH